MTQAVTCKPRDLSLNPQHPYKEPGKEWLSGLHTCMQTHRNIPDPFTRVHTHTCMHICTHAHMCMPLLAHKGYNIQAEHSASFILIGDSMLSKAWAVQSLDLAWIMHPCWLCWFPSQIAIMIVIFIFLYCSEDHMGDVYGIKWSEIPQM